MKALTKTLVTASLALGTAGANAAIVNDKTFAAEAFLSVYDSASKGTFTLDLGVALGDLINNINNAAYTLNFDLSGLADWGTFKANAGNEFSNTKYLVAAGGVDAFEPHFVATGSNPINGGFDFDTLNAGVNKISQQAGRLNQDAVTLGSDIGTNNTTYVVDGQAGIVGQHGDANSLWQTPVNHNPEAAYGDAVDFWMTDIQDFTSSQVSQFAGQWKLDGDTLTYGAVSAVPVPAAVWLFGSAMLGMLGISRRKTAA